MENTLGVVRALAPLLIFHQPFKRLSGLMAIMPQRNFTFTNIHIFSRIRTQVLREMVGGEILHIVDLAPAVPSGRGSRVEWVSEQRSTLNLSRAETSSRWYDVAVRRGGASSGVVHVT
ncbi:hypothetical protein TNCV_1345741 [Trichonephila clavipes]|nr:hypothetical protein TNCV_1345741 [Trichonephila clavipes]